MTGNHPLPNLSLLIRSVLRDAWHNVCPSVLSGISIYLGPLRDEVWLLMCFADLHIQRELSQESSTVSFGRARWPLKEPPPQEKGHPAWTLVKAYLLYSTDDATLYLALPSLFFPSPSPPFSSYTQILSRNTLGL